MEIIHTFVMIEGKPAHLSFQCFLNLEKTFRVWSRAELFAGVLVVVFGEGSALSVRL